MDAVTQALADQLDELRVMVANVDEAAWAKRLSCPGWSNRDVLLHLAQTNEIATASANRSSAEALELMRTFA